MTRAGMTMNLLAILGIQAAFIPRNCGAAVNAAQDLWVQVGRPTDAETIMDILETVIADCQARNVPYPKIFLRRKKQIERGELAGSL